MEPKCIWVKALIRKSEEDSEAEIKFNKMLDEVLTTKEGHYVLDVNAALNDEIYFHRNGTLNGIGEVRFWKEINHQLELFDQRRISLKPVSKRQNESPARSRGTPNQRRP